MATYTTNDPTSTADRASLATGASTQGLMSTPRQRHPALPGAFITPTSARGAELLDRHKGDKHDRASARHIHTCPVHGRDSHIHCRSDGEGAPGRRMRRDLGAR